MSKPTVQFNDFVSLAVMLLMVVALVAGQADASAYAADRDTSITPITATAPVASFGDHFDIDFNGRLSDKALQASIAIVTDLSHFRGEDE